MTSSKTAWRSELTTIAGSAKPSPDAPGLALWVHLDAGFARFDLPRRGPVLIGRAPDSVVYLDQPKISRRHARLLISEQVLTLEDLGSRNGTSIAELSLSPGQPRVIEIGAGFSLGGLAAVVLAVPAPAASTTQHPLGVVVQDQQMQAVYEEAKRLAQGNISVLILGETGVGKERVAETIHQNSGRADKPLFRINCAALTESLLESELFGHEKGAFTGAVEPRAGLLERANGGSVFFDEVGELSPAAQAKMLRVLEEGTVVRVGGSKARSIDVRFTFATNRDLEFESQQGKFRTDLYYRIGAATLRIPPLRERPADIAPLARLFSTTAFARLSKPPASLSEGAIALLQAHPWPGNVRELRNVMERAALLCRGPQIVEADLPMAKGNASPSTLTAPAMAAVPAASNDVLGGAINKDSIARALLAAGGNQAKAAALLGISRATLGRRMDALGVVRPRKG